MEPNLKNKGRSEKEIIAAAITKAILNGYDFKHGIKDPGNFEISSYNPSTGRLALLVRGKENFKVLYDSYKLIFFEIDFAKALFGKKWEKHLEELAVATNVFHYLKTKL